MNWATITVGIEISHPPIAVTKFIEIDTREPKKDNGKAEEDC